MFMAKKAMLAFNIQNVYHLESLARAAKELNAPVIAQVSAKYISELDERHGLSRLTQQYQKGLVFCHLDHCMDEAVIRRCVDAGFAGVMFDGSSLPVEENIQRTNRVYEYAHQRGVLVEAELGAIKGVEDGVGTDNGRVYSLNELEVFYREAHFDLLALAIGNAHGEYINTSGIKIDLLVEAKGIIGEFPLVLHGGTGMPDQMIHDAIDAGVVKINVSTALKAESIKAIKKYTGSSIFYDEGKYTAACLETFVPFFRTFISKFSI